MQNQKKKKKALTNFHYKTVPNDKQSKIELQAGQEKPIQ